MINEIAISKPLTALHFPIAVLDSTLRLRYGKPSPKGFLRGQIAAARSEIKASRAPLQCRREYQKTIFKPSCSVRFPPLNCLAFRKSGLLTLAYDVLKAFVLS